ncbi:unnamed protein product [Adineta ricciae]|uniref:Uncharacterized protein n=1 Tax=Adineta ricciae TaxID=249248 RepID=A0A816GR12_ADIRI|nr:unnamed protein product [Adineta ricciae]
MAGSYYSSSSYTPTIYSLNSNPLLNTFQNEDTAIQPYFIVVAQFLFFEICFRLWNRFIYGTWLLSSDFIDIRIIPSSSRPSIRKKISPIRIFSPFDNQKAILLKTNDDLEEHKKKPTFDLFDIVFSCLPLIGHAIWYCIIQGTSDCKSAGHGTTWNCYNLFGYRVYNYLFDPFSMFAFEYISKWIILRDKRLHHIPWIVRKQNSRRILVKIIFYSSMVISTITFVFVAALLFPYIFTNVIPMTAIYSFIVIIYVYIVTIYTCFLKLFTFISKKIFKSDDKNDELPRIQVAVKKYYYKRRLIIRFAVRWSPHLIPFLYNLSQYFYYNGGDYIDALNQEASSRYVHGYFERMTNSSQIAHTILTTL